MFKPDTTYHSHSPAYISTGYHQLNSDEETTTDTHSTATTLRLSSLTGPVQLSGTGGRLTHRAVTSSLVSHPDCVPPPV
ncbi:hypothetical protein RvY_08778 [Ramazzottius varieornatus]|uniref:Uncharacterized protein n=1 Tax=Ramazzottius varieornatus TaxID=947166 RepID=A0A1D1V9M3_RAMVA|nr:hypothetical protein RvY_08778 [Ramazzottius varieornatus]